MALGLPQEMGEGGIPLNRCPALDSLGTDSRNQERWQSTDLEAFFHSKGSFAIVQNIVFRVLVFMLKCFSLFKSMAM